MPAIAPLSPTYAVARADFLDAAAAAGATVTTYPHPLTGLRAIDGVEIRGITNLERLSHRVPTVSFTRPGLDNTAVARHLADHNVYVWSGHNYALPVVDALGIRDQGVVRVGPTHYNTLDEIDTVVALAAEFLRAG